MVFELMDLPFATNDLEPYFDEETIKIHHGKHHQAYVNNLNKAIANFPDLKDKSVEWLLQNLNSIPEEIKQAVINHGGGVYNHNFFWFLLKKEVEISPTFLDVIKAKFVSYDEFKEEFSKKALTLFGSGWTWLVLNHNQELEIVQTFNQESVISKGMTPLLTLDVWEHAYYLKYQNKRAEFIENFFKVIDWQKVEQLYRQAKV